MTLPDLAGRTALLQRTMPNPRAKVIIEGNLLAAEARKHAELGNKVMGDTQKDTKNPGGNVEGLLGGNGKPVGSQAPRPRDGRYFTQQPFKEDPIYMIFYHNEKR